MDTHMSEESPKQAIPDDGLVVSRPQEDPTNARAEMEAGLQKSFDDVLGALTEGMIPHDLEGQLFDAMAPTTQRELIARASGLDSSILSQFKQQTLLVDNILRRTFNEDGTVRSSEEDLGVSPKDAMNMSIRLTQIMVKELPKIYNMDRIARLEESIFNVMHKYMTRDQQDELLAELDAQQGGKDSRR